MCFKRAVLRSKSLEIDSFIRPFVRFVVSTKISCARGISNGFIRLVEAFFKRSKVSNSLIMVLLGSSRFYAYISEPRPPASQKKLTKWVNKSMMELPFLITDIPR